MKSSMLTQLIVGALIAVFGCGVASTASGQTVQTLGFANLNTDSGMGLSVDIPTLNNSYIGLLPNLNLQYGMGNQAIGLDIGFAVFIPDNEIPDNEENDTQTAMRSFVLNYKTKNCSEGETQVCYGGHVALGIDPFDRKLEDDLGLILVGSFTELMRFSRFGSESMGLDMLLVLSISNPAFYFQASLGPSFFVPLTHAKKGEGGHDAEANLLYELEAGGILKNLLAVGVAFRGVSFLTLDYESDSIFALDFNLRLVNQKVSPFLRFRVPFHGFYSDLMDFSTMVGVNFTF